MVGTNEVGWLGLFIAWGTAAMAMAGTGADEGPFRDLSLDRARQAATDRGKRLVLVDFYTVWCGPCKKLDETTWKDQEVRDWLSKEAVCLKVDAEKDQYLADKYRINVYPTVLLLRPDGAEIDRLVGYRDAKTFLADAREALAGNNSLTRARKRLEGAKANDPSLRMSYGDALAQKGASRRRAVRVPLVLRPRAGAWPGLHGCATLVPAGPDRPARADLPGGARRATQAARRRRQGD